MSHHDHSKHERALHLGVGLSSPFWTATWFAVGLSAAYWWWSQLGRPVVSDGVISALPAPLGPSPERARPSPAGQSGEAPVEVAPPELVMAHSPPPAEAPDHPAHPSDEAIPEPPPEMLAHTPPESVGVSFKPRSGFENPTEQPESVFPAPVGAQAGEGSAASAGPSSRGASGPPATHAVGEIDRQAALKPRLNTPSSESAPSVILASPPGVPVFDPETLATETSVAALTAGEVLDQTAAPEQAISEPSPAPRPRTRRKPGTAPEA